MKVRISASRASGTICAPVSKSHLHRLLFATALAAGKSVIHGVSEADDVLATVNCLTALGAEIIPTEDGFCVFGTDMRHTAPRRALMCRESGSTLRFVIPIATLSGARVHITGKSSLLARPLDAYDKIFSERLMLLSQNGRILTVDGPLEAGDFSVHGGVSSQFISGLLLALPLLDGESTLTVEPPFVSRGYVDLTLSVLESFDIFVGRRSENVFYVPGGQSYTPGEYRAEGDWSSAASVLALNFLGGECTVQGLNASSYQPDSCAGEVFSRIAAHTAEPIDLSDTPDLAPISFALAAALGGASFIGTGRLRHKESDRAAAMKAELEKLGCSITVSEDSVTVPACELHAPNEPISSHNDHRIAMAMAILLSRLGGEIEGAECVKKSYPDFFRDLATLGIGIAEES